MRLKPFLLLLALASTSIAAHADTITYGPVTFGSNAPLGSDGFVSQYSILPMYAPGVDLSPPNAIGDASFTQTIAFYFDLAPGWSIANLRFTDFTDWGTGQNDPSNWGYEYAQKITLCTVGRVCSSASTGEHQGGFSMPSLSLDAQARPNAGIYQAAGYSHNAQVRTKPLDSTLNIFLTQTALVPEPSTLLLMATGTLGLLGVVRSKRVEI